MMNILALIGSPRKKGNTDILIDQILKGSEKKGHLSEKRYLYDYDISPCIDCRACKRGDSICPLKDGMRELYPRIENADLLLLGAPNYWYGPPAKMKLLIDRLRPFVMRRRLEGKKWIVVSPSAEGPKSCRFFLESFHLSFDYLGMEFGGKLLVKAYEKGEIKKDPKALKMAYEPGLSLKSK
jgi:multimeric flavodoxin WrbA